MVPVGRRRPRPSSRCIVVSERRCGNAVGRKRTGGGRRGRGRRRGRILVSTAPDDAADVARKGLGDASKAAFLLLAAAHAVRRFPRSRLKASRGRSRAFLRRVRRRSERIRSEILGRAVLCSLSGLCDKLVEHGGKGLVHLLRRRRCHPLLQRAHSRLIQRVHRSRIDRMPIHLAIQVFKASQGSIEVPVEGKEAGSMISRLAGRFASRSKVERSQSILIISLWLSSYRSARIRGL